MIGVGRPRSGGTVSPTRRVLVVLVRGIALVCAGYLVYALWVGTSEFPREQVVFWTSGTAALVGLATSVVRGQKDPVKVTWHVLLAVAAVALVGALVTYRDPWLLRFGHAVALATGNAVTLAVATWLGSTALTKGDEPG